jgi:hypothetical protein
LKKENLKMGLPLVGADDVESTEQPNEATIPREDAVEEEKIDDFKVSKGLTVVLEDVLDLTTGGMEMHGFKRHAHIHLTKDYEVEYFIKGPNVIMADYHGTNSVKIEVLGRKEADMIINELNN